jgi:hypothetical protein
LAFPIPFHLAKRKKIPLAEIAEARREESKSK